MLIMNLNIVWKLKAKTAIKPDPGNKLKLATLTILPKLSNVKIVFPETTGVLLLPIEVLHKFSNGFFVSPRKNSSKTFINI